MDYSKYGIDEKKPLLGYGNSDLKNLRSKFERYKDYEESCRMLPETVGGALTGEGRSAARYLKSALDLLSQSGAWSGPDGDSCRRVIETLYSDTNSHYAKLEQVAQAMEQKAQNGAESPKNGERDHRGNQHRSPSQYEFYRQTGSQLGLL